MNCTNSPRKCACDDPCVLGLDSLMHIQPLVLMKHNQMFERKQQDVLRRRLRLRRQGATQTKKKQKAPEMCIRGW
jgi:hypothetical protein